jgi:hypothetical protein
MLAYTLGYVHNAEVIMMECCSLAVCIDINGSKSVMAWGPNKDKDQCLKEYYAIKTHKGATIYSLALKDHKDATLEKPISSDFAKELIDDWYEIELLNQQDLDIHW